MLAAAQLLSVVTTISPSFSSSASPEPDVELKRGAFFGAKVGPVSDEVRERLKLDEGMAP